MQNESPPKDWRSKRIHISNIQRTITTYLRATWLGSVTYSDTMMCGITTEGEYQCGKWTWRDGPSEHEALQGGAPYKDISAGGWYIRKQGGGRISASPSKCLLMESGNAYCGMQIVPSIEPKTYTKITGDRDYACGLTEDGSVDCWTGIGLKSDRIPPPTYQKEALPTSATMAPAHML